MKRLYWMMLVLAVMVAALSPADASAQRRGRGQGGQGGQGGPGGRGFGGFGGFGGGMRGGAGRGMQLDFQLLGNDKVKADLELLDEQSEEIAKIRENAPRPSFPENFREMSEEERAEAIEKMQKEAGEAEKKMRDQLAEVLLPPQMERLTEIKIQLMGLAGAVNMPEVQEKLKITEAQQEKITAAMEEVQSGMREKMQELMQQARGGGGERPDFASIMEENRKATEDAVKKVLTADQVAGLEKMKGETIDLTLQDLMGGFGGRGGRGGRGGDGGGPRRPGGGAGGGGGGGGL